MQLTYFRWVLNDIQYRLPRSGNEAPRNTRIVCKMSGGEIQSGMPMIIDRITGETIVALESQGNITYIDVEKVMSVTTSDQRGF